MDRRDNSRERSWLIQGDAQKEGSGCDPEQREALTIDERGTFPQTEGEKKRVTPCVGIRKSEITCSKNRTFPLGIIS